MGTLALLGSTPAMASELSWDGPSDCASRDALSFELERALSVPLERAGRLRFEVRVERSESMASARLEVSSLDASGRARTKQRLLVAEDCSTLVDTLAVAIGLAIGASEMQRPAATGLDAHATSSAPAALDSSAVPAPASSPPTGHEPTNEPGGDGDGSSDGLTGLRPSVFLELVGDGGALPDPGLGATLGAGLHAGRAAARVSGTLLLDQRVRLGAAAPSGAAEVGLGFGTLQGCLDGAGVPARWALPLCVGVDVGQLWGRGVDVARPRREASWWVAPRFDAGLFWSLPRTTLRAGGWLTLSAPLRRDEFVVDEVGVVHRPGLVVGRVAIGIDASLE
jgi:hypothetical protein